MNMKKPWTAFKLAVHGFSLFTQFFPAGIKLKKLFVKFILACAKRHQLFGR